MSAYIGVDIGGTYIRFSYLKGNEKKFFGFEKFKLDNTNLLQTIQFLLDCYIARHKLHPKGICVGIPGVLNEDRSKILNIPNRKSLNNVDIRQKLSHQFKCKVFLEKDVNLILLKNITDINFTKHQKNLLGFYIGTGFGHAICIDGNIIIGGHGMSGEIGHIQIPNAKKKCTCGKIGCVETLYSGLALSEYASKKYRGIAIGDIFDFYAQDLYLQKFVQGIAHVISMSVAILDPLCIFIGGGIVNMKHFPKKELKNSIIKSLRIPNYPNRLKIVFTKNNHKNGTYGACIYAKQRM